MTPDGWCQTTLEQVANVAIGKTPARNEKCYWDPEKTTRNRWATIADIKSKSIGDTTEYISDLGVQGSNARLVPEGTLLMSFKLSLGRVAITSTPMYTNEAIAAFYPNGLANTEYLYYLLPTLALEESSDRAVKGLTLNKAKLRALQLVLPPADEQRKIVAILSSVDDAIEKTQAVIDQVQVVKRGLMQELLTRGLPGRHTRFKPLPNWRLGRVASNLKQIPESWDLVSIASVARLESGHTPSRRKPQYWHGNVPWISLHDTVQLDRPEIRNTEQNISELGLKNSSARLLPKGTVVFSRTATIGKSTIMAREMSTTQDFVNYTCGSRLHNRYLMQLLRHMRPEWRRLMAGSTHKTVYMPIFEQLEILLPPVEEQEEIANIVERLESRVETERKVNARLGNLKSALMSVLLSGELRVTPDTEAA